MQSPRLIIIAIGIISAVGFYLYSRPHTRVLGISTQVPFIVTHTPTPSSTPTPTLTPTPTITPSPTSTPSPTYTPTPTNTPTPLPKSQYENYFEQYSNQYAVDINVLKKIAHCESGMGPGAQNGPYGGMFQYTEVTWKSIRMQMGADPNPALRFGIKESIETAAFHISREGTKPWQGCV